MATWSPCPGTGAGKTALARFLVRALAGDPRLEVPSPTFSLVITYEFGRGKVTHADLYRLADPEELDEIGWDEMCEDGSSSWNGRTVAGSHMPASRLDVALELAPDLGPDARRALLVGSGAFAERLDRLNVAEYLIESSGFGKASGAISRAMPPAAPMPASSCRTDPPC